MTRLRVLPERVFLALVAAPASSDHYKFLVCVGGQCSQGILSPVFEDECDCLAKVRKAILPRGPLTVSPRHLRAVSHVPRAVPLNNGSELVPHTLSVNIRRLRNRCTAAVSVLGALKPSRCIGGGPARLPGDGHILLKCPEPGAGTRGNRL